MTGINAIDDIEARYQHFRETLTESAQQVERTTRQKWMTTPILQKMEQRRLDKGNVALYNLLGREIRQDCRTTKETMLTEQCQVIEQLDAAHKSNLMHSQIKLVTGRKRGNNTGPDGITTEMLVAAGEVGIFELTELSTMIHNQGSFPSDLNKSIFITLPKVNGTIQCEKHRTINLRVM